MHNNEFEKKVGHKLEELKFTPSDAVWQKVKAQIRVHKHRRRFLFWWLPAAVLCVGVIGWFIYTLQTNRVIPVAKTGAEKEIQSSSIKKGSLKSINPVAEKKPEVEESNEPPVSKKEAQQLPSPPNGKLFYKMKTDEPVKAGQVVYQKKNKTKKDAEQTVAIDDDKTTGHVTVKPAENKTNHQPVSVVEPAIEKKQDTITVAIKEGTRTEENKPGSTDSSVTPINKITEVKNDLPQTKKKKTEVALNFRTGISDMSNFSAGSNAADRFYAAQNISGPGAPLQYVPSKAKPSAAFTAGIQLKKPVSKRSAFSLALAYSYYSSSHKTGNTVDSPAQFGSSVNNTVVNRFERDGSNNTFISRYHFIELPLMYHWQLNKPGKRPVQLNTGVAFSYLISSNALYYHSATGNYYYDPKLFNRSQLQLRSGISVGMIKKMNYPLQLELQYQYGLTGQWKKSLNLNQHLSFTGIQLSWRLNKK